MKRTWLGYVVVLLVGIMFLAVNVWSAQPKFPDKPMEFVVQAGAGGASDLFVRTITRMITEQKLMTVPITVNNQAGGGGAIANNYMKHREGSPYYLLHCGGTFLTAPLRDPSVAGYKDFTPIARLTIDLIGVVVRSDSPYKTIKDLVDAAKKRKPGGINWAATGVGQEYHLIMIKLGELSGTQYNHVSFTSTNEVTAALLGGHVEVGSMQPSVAQPLVKAGKLRLLAVSSEKRLSALADFPTFKEQGYDVVMSFSRGFVAPGKIPDDAKNSLSAIFEKLSQSTQWKEYTAKQGSVPSFLPADEYKKFFVEESAKYEKLMRKAGIIK